MKLVRGVLLLALSSLALVAHAEVKQSAVDGFFIAFTDPVAATTQKTWADIVQPQRWWSNEHTWSGSAANLSLKPEAGGCFCEKWKDSSVEQGRVVMALPGKLLRLETALGPLQEFALKGTLSFWIKGGDDGATELNVEYRVNGSSSSTLDAFAPQVDAMLGAQVARLVRYIDSGNPEEPPPVIAPAQANARSAILDEWAKRAAADKAAENPPPSKARHPAPKAKPSKIPDGS